MAICKDCDEIFHYLFIAAHEAPSSLHFCNLQFSPELSNGNIKYKRILLVSVRTSPHDDRGTRLYIAND